MQFGFGQIPGDRVSVASGAIAGRGAIRGNAGEITLGIKGVIPSGRVVAGLSGHELVGIVVSVGGGDGLATHGAGVDKGIAHRIISVSEDIGCAISGVGQTIKRVISVGEGGGDGGRVTPTRLAQGLDRVGAVARLVVGV